MNSILCHVGAEGHLPGGAARRVASPTRTPNDSYSRGRSAWAFRLHDSNWRML